MKSFEKEKKKGREVETEREEGKKLKEEKLEIVRNLLFRALVMEIILSLCEESSQGIVWGNKASWDCWRMPGTPAWDTESVRH